MNNRIHDPFNTGRQAVPQIDPLAQKAILYSNVGNLYRTAAEHYRRLGDLLANEKDIESVEDSARYKELEEDLLEEAAFYAQGAADAAAEQCAQFFPESLIDNRTKSDD